MILAGALWACRLGLDAETRREAEEDAEKQKKGWRGWSGEHGVSTSELRSD